MKISNELPPFNTYCRYQKALLWIKHPLSEWALNPATANNLDNDTHIGKHFFYFTVCHEVWIV